jgi:hypothetical protein
VSALFKVKACVRVRVFGGSDWSDSPAPRPQPYVAPDQPQSRDSASATESAHMDPGKARNASLLDELTGVDSNRPGTSKPLFSARSPAQVFLFHLLIFLHGQLFVHLLVSEYSLVLNI